MNLGLLIAIILTLGLVITPFRDNILELKGVFI